MNALIGCEISGAVRDELRDREVNAWSCDILDIEDFPPGECGEWVNYHLTGDVRWWLTAGPDGPWDMAIFFPPCTYLSVSGIHWNTRRPERAKKTAAAYEFFMELWNAPIKRVAVENPVGIMSTRWREPNQYIQPYQFGDDASKKTGLWLRNLPLLVADPRQRVAGRIVTCKGKQVERWANQTDSGQNRLGPSESRARERGVTYAGIARAMAEQWGGV